MLFLMKIAFLGALLGCFNFASAGFDASSKKNIVLYWGRILFSESQYLKANRLLR
ncbi:hypothetical protein BU16DRAFT_524424 [Lophium mytilinum]|uniref:Uncharacterized protein n=1 Tax=Lophium mytilinum TaxID=390894 RepID=A0A6A6R217_9PEZI|nr:hypothetical protein BU16DRAFT_524424 [Lophium mytilinum]